MRKSGMCEKLSQSWVGPYPISKVNSPLSYQLDAGTKKKQSVHIRRLKCYEERLHVGKESDNGIRARHTV